jgi:hypothetical protein
MLWGQPYSTTSPFISCSTRDFVAYSHASRSGTVDAAIKFIHQAKKLLNLEEKYLGVILNNLATLSYAAGNYIDSHKYSEMGLMKIEPMVLD